MITQISFQSPCVQAKRHWSTDGLLYSLLRMSQSSAGQRRDRHLEERTWESNCFSHNLSIRPPAFVSTVLATHSTCYCCGNCLNLGSCTGKGIVFVFLLAHNFIFLGLLKSFTISPSAFRFQNILAVVSSPFSFSVLAGLYPLSSRS